MTFGTLRNHGQRVHRLLLAENDHAEVTKAGSWLCNDTYLRMVRMTMAVPRISTSKSSDVRMRSPNFW